METPPKPTTGLAGLHALWRSDSYRRLWAVGTVVNATRWVEMLAAALFTYQVTGSDLAVALVSAARPLPMLLFGALAGAVSDAVDRKRILVAGLAVSIVAAGSILVLALLGLARPWHVAIAAFASGCVWATEMSTRRRMAGEAAGPALMPRAVAMDSLTAGLTRMLGPVIGSGAYATFGLVGAYAISVALLVVAFCCVPGLVHVQTPRRLALRPVLRDLLEGLAYARQDRTIRAVMAVTIAMNLFAFSYVPLLAPLVSTVFQSSAAMAGVLAAAEPFGSLLAGMVLAGRTPTSDARRLMLLGSAAFMVGLAFMAHAPGIWSACVLLAAGGMGLALFSNMQTGLVLTRVPAAVRSRQMGLITVCIGAGPLGQMLAGLVARSFGPVAAITTLAVTGLATLAAVAVWWLRGSDVPRLRGQ